MEKIKVILSDIQVLFREGIHFILSGEEDFEVTGEASNNEEAMALIDTSPPDIAILGMQNRRLLGPDITQRVWLMRRMYSQMTTDPPNGAGMTFGQATEAILEEMKRTENNMEFLETLNK